MTELGLKDTQVAKQMYVFKSELNKKKLFKIFNRPLIYSVIWHFLNNEDYLGQKEGRGEIEEEPKINVYKYKTEYD